MGWKDKERAREYNRKHYLENREHYLQYQKDRNAKHREYMREYRAKMYKDKEKERARCRDYHRRHKEEVNAKHRKHYWKAKGERCGEPTTLEEFREWFGYPPARLKAGRIGIQIGALTWRLNVPGSWGAGIDWHVKTISRHATRCCWKQQSAGCTSRPWRCW